jgi:hypothetical protein
MQEAQHFAAAGHSFRGVLRAKGAKGARLELIAEI